MKGWLKMLLVSLMIAVALHGENSMDAEQKYEKATFAGGCFWCLEPPFDKVDGVVDTIVGYAGGYVDQPTYEEVSSGSTGHAEVIQVVYDPSKVDYSTLLEIFWKNIDPTVKNRQFCDIGSQYRSAIFYSGESQRNLAEASKKRIEEKFGLVHTEIVPLQEFYEAEDYHQNYYIKNPIRYKFYRYSCGRDERLSELWD